MATEWMLTTESLDNDRKTHYFRSKQEALDFAVVWFATGYDPETTRQINGVPWGVANDVAQLIDDLSNGREFYCGRFHEHLTLEEER